MYPGSNLGPAWLAARLNGRGSLEIYTGVSRLIDSGELPAGARLPTVRELSPLLQVSSATLIEAWTRLRDEAYIETRRRGGTIVLERPGSQGLGTHPQALAIDMSQSIARAELQPDLQAALLAGLKVATLHRPEREYITEALREAVKPTWPFKPAALTTVAGGAEATFCAMAATLGDRRHIALEHPTSPTLITVAGELGARISSVPCDAEGPEPSALKAALEAGADSFVYQPCAQVPVGHAVSERRRSELADVLRAYPQVKVAEIDLAGPLAVSETRSLGQVLPDQVIYSRAYCRAFGIDLKSAVIGGAEPLVRRLIDLRCKGYTVTSRILQTALAWLLTDASALADLRYARDYYAARRLALAGALQARDVDCRAEDGLFVWVPVRQEAAALSYLSSHGIEGSPGSRCNAGHAALAPHIRLAVTGLPENADFVATVADVVQQACVATAELD
ncbi:GntR family transcriptional regulator [Comamonas sp. BIGb0124]|uniref:aminotransferase class I/II-fold pyridoxal phosphate-dependent enzyme n=1 Tax=Comamonas sp. BIGb0124 TaxID=2485130 RepID=UPI000FB77958|nr:aminotransferase class I/II-fold pyridoxal phosphate-dependent enzyme [Comamonas sp. BIGb0124]ROR22424.1 GntR family transcriptional regulator [Comamonas sp. BIGb0124]